MEYRESGRFQLWEYLVSHRHLLLRHPPDAGESGNVDFVFSGVKYVALPSIILDPVVRDAEPRELDEASIEAGMPIDVGDLYIVEGQGARGFVVATSFERVKNTLDLFDSGLLSWADPHRAAESFERSVLLALASLRPEIEPRHPIRTASSRQLDALVHIADRAIGLEIRWINSPSQGVIRSQVINLVETVNAWTGYLEAMLVVVSARDPIFLRALNADLTTALGASMQVEVLGWQPGDVPEQLIDAVQRLGGE